MEIIICIKVKYTPNLREPPDYVLRHLGRDGEEVRWKMFNDGKRNVAFSSKEVILEKFPEAIYIDKVFPAEYCPTLEEIPLEALT